MGRSSAGKFALCIWLFAVLITAATMGQVDVMFYDDFENLSAGDTPDMFLPSGSANPDWDNAVLNPEGATLALNGINGGDVGGNSTNKYELQPWVEAPVLLGANFNPSTERYVTIEYDVLINNVANKTQSGEIYYADGYGDLDGTGGATKIAIHLQFNDNADFPDDASPPGKNGFIYRTEGQDNDVTTTPPTDTGYERITSIAWSASTWYRVQVIADQVNKTYDLKVTDKSTGQSYTELTLPFNDPTAGYIRKVWFGVTTYWPVYFDNIYIYQGSTSPPVDGPSIIFNEYSKGPVNANTGLDVDFSDDTELTAIQYKIGTGGTWTDLTSEGSTPFDLVPPPSVTLVNAPVFITDADFAALPEGPSPIYFRAIDVDSIITESAAYLLLTKDSQPPYIASIMVPNASEIGELTELSGYVADAVSGLAANTATITLIRDSDGWFWNGAADWQSAPIDLPTTHAATSDGTAVVWTFGGTPPSAALGDIGYGQSMTARVSVNDSLSNGVFSGTPVTFRIIDSYPTIILNVSSVGPANLNVNAGINITFSDDSDLELIRYKIGTGGIWTDLTIDGTNPANDDLIGSTDTLYTNTVFIDDDDFTAISDGQYELYFRARDDLGNTTETIVPVQFKKDSSPPSVISFTTPASDPFSSLPTVAGQIADSSGGFGINANVLTYTIKDEDDVVFWTGSGWGVETQLPTTHGGTTGSEVANWVKNSGIPTLSDLVLGHTYTFTAYVTDSAENNGVNSVSYLFDSAPEIASVTDPVDGSSTGTAFTIGGLAADHEGGVGLGQDSTKFTYVRASDGYYWSGTDWQVGIANLPTLHDATSGSDIVAWTANVTLPTAGELSNGDYYFQATATNLEAIPKSFTGAMVSATYAGGADTVPPVLSAVITEDTTGDGFIDRLTATFNEAVNDGMIDPIAFTTNIGTVTSVTDDVNPADPVIWIFLADGVLATDAVPLLSIDPAGIEDTSGNPNDQISGFPSTDGAGPAVLSASTVTSSEVEVIFSEAVKDATAAGSDFLFRNFASTGANAAGIGITTNTPNDDVLRVSLAATVGTGETAQIQFAGNGVISDNAAVPVGNTQTSWIEVTDGLTPAISGAVLDASNDFIDITFSEGVWSDVGASAPIGIADFSLVFEQNGSAAIATISSVSDTLGGALAGGESVIRVNLSITGTPDGAETVEIKSAGGTAIYDAASNAVPAVASSGVLFLNDKLAPSGYTVTFDQPAVNAGNQTAVSFTFAAAEIGTTYSYSIEDGANPPVTGSGPISGAGGQISDIELSSLADGPLTLTFFLTDTAGNQGADTTDSVTKDTVAPAGYAVSFDQTIVNVGNQNAVSFTFAAAEVLSDYSYSIDDGVNAPLTGTDTISSGADQITRDVSTLDDGPLTLAVYLTDTAGNQGADTTDTVTKDTASPSIISALIAADNSYADITFDEGIWRDLSATAPVETADFQITFTQNLGGATDAVIAGVANSAGGALVGGETVIRVLLAITDAPTGVETVELTPATDTSIYDGAENAALSSETSGLLTLYAQDFPVIVSGTVAPDNSYIDVNFNKGVYTDDPPSNPVEAADFQITFTQNLGGASGAAITGVTNTSGGALSGGETAIRVLLSITGTPTGVETVEITPASAAAIYDDSTNAVADTETTGALPLLDQTAPAGYSATFDQLVVNTSNQTSVSFTFADAEVSADYSYSIDDGVNAPVTGTGTISSIDDQITDIDVSGLDDGPLTLTAYLTDDAGNQGTDVIDTVTKDATPPPPFSATFDQTVVNASSQTSVSFTFAGAEIGATYSYSIDDGVNAPVADSGTISNGADQITGIDVSALDDGPLTLTVYLTDGAGNAGADVADTVTKDATPPPAPVATFDQTVVNAANAAAISFTFSAAEVGAAYSFSIDDTSGATSPETGEGTIDAATDQVSGIDVRSLADGTLTLTFCLIDSAGNEGPDATDTVTKDANPPSGYSVAFDQSAANAANETTLSFTFAGAEPGATYTFDIDDSNGTTPPVIGNGSISTATDQIPNIDVSGLNDGTLTLAAQLTDPLPAANPGDVVTATIEKDTVAGFSSASISSDNSYVDIYFAEAVWTDDLGTGPVEIADFVLNFTPNGSTATASIASLSDTGGSALSGGESTVRINLLITGVPNGFETIEITPASGVAIYDGAANSVSAGETTGSLPLIDQSVPKIISSSLSFDNSYIDIYFNKGVWTDIAATAPASAADFTLEFIPYSGTATDAVISAVTGLSGGPLLGGDTSVRINLSVTGTPSGDETVEIKPVSATAIFDNSANALDPDDPLYGTTGPIFLNDKVAPSGYSVAFDQSIVNASNQTSVSFTFAGAETGATYFYSIDDTNSLVPPINGSGTVISSNMQVNGIDTISLGDDILTLTVYIRDPAGNIGVDVTDSVTKKATVPDIDFVYLAPDNSYVEIRFDDGVWSDVAATAPITPADFSLNFVKNGGNASAASVNGITGIGGVPLAGGETVIWANIMLIDAPSGVETVEIVPANASSIYDAAENALPLSASTGQLLLHDQFGPSGYAVTFDQSAANAANQSAMSITFTGAEVGASFTFLIDDDANAGTLPVTGSGFISAATQQITGLDFSSLDDGLLSLTANLTDTAGNAGTDASDTIVKDTGTPIITGAAIAPDNTYMEITFSEGMWADSSATLPVLRTDFSLTFAANSGSSTGASISSLTDGAGSPLAGGESVIRAFLSISGTPSGVESVQIGPVSDTALYDGAGNAASVANVSPVLVLNDKTPPVITSLETVDIDGDGYIDAIHIQFSEQINDASITAADFDVVSIDGESFNSNTSGDIADDNDIFIAFADDTLDSGQTPAINYTAGTLEDLSGNLLADYGPAVSTDMVGPAIISAVAGDGTDILVGIDSDDTVTITFSEYTNQPSVDALNIDTILSLSGGHTWLDGSGAVGSATWIDAKTLAIGISTLDGDPTVAAGDAISLGGGVVTDLAAAAASTVPFSSISGSFSADLVPPVLSSLTTADLNGDGFIERMIAVFSEPVDEGTLVADSFELSDGSISTVIDDGVAANSIIYIEIDDGLLLSDAVPLLTVSQGAIEDLPGNKIDLISNYAPVDGAAPVIIETLAIAGEKSIYIAFSEPVISGSSPLSTTDFTYTDSANLISAVAPINSNGGGAASEMFLLLSDPLKTDDILLPQTVGILPGSAADISGNAVSTVPYRISDLALGVVFPLWASDGVDSSSATAGKGTNTVIDFDGTETLRPRDIIIQVQNQSGQPIELIYNVVTAAPVSASARSSASADQVLSISQINALFSSERPISRTLAAETVNGDLHNFFIPGSELLPGVTVEFVLTVAGLSTARVINPKDPRILAVWSFTIADIKLQKAGVTILSNVIDPSRGEDTRVVYSIARRGNVMVLVSDANANLVTVLQRGIREEGDYHATWDGRNNGGRAVAPGIYFIKVIGPDINEVRKVLVVRRSSQ